MDGVLALVDGWGSTVSVLKLAADEADRRGAPLIVAEVPDELPADARALRRAVLRLAVRDVRRTHPGLITALLLGRDAIDALDHLDEEHDVVVTSTEHLAVPGVLDTSTALLVVDDVTDATELADEDPFAGSDHLADDEAEREIAELEALFRSSVAPA